jgi:hypothetical protein
MGKPGTALPGVISQKMLLFITIAFKTSNPVYHHHLLDSPVRTMAFFRSFLLLPFS